MNSKLNDFAEKILLAVMAGIIADWLRRNWQRGE